MKISRWLKTLFLIALIIAGIAVAQLYLHDPVHLRYGDWEAAPPLSLVLAAAVIFLVILTLAIKILMFLLFFPARLTAWQRQRAYKQRQEALAGGVRAMALHDNKSALKYFSLLSENKRPDAGVHAWLAAVAAEKIGDTKKRKDLLRQVTNGNIAELAAAAKARLACDDNRLSEAFNILITAGAPDQSPVLAKMFLDIAQRRGEWPAALAAAYQLRSMSPSPKWKKAVADIVRQGLDAIDNVAKLTDFWKNHVRADERKSAVPLADYIYALHRLGDEKNANDTLERAVKIAGETPEMMTAVATLGNKKLCETTFAANEKRAETSGSTHQLSALALLAERLGLWGKARRYYQMANSLRSDPRYLQALAELEEKMKKNTNTGT